MLGDLQLRGIEPGIALHLLGAKRREQLPDPGTAVTLSILLGEEVLSLCSVLLEPLVAAEGDTLFPPVLRVAWPTEAIAFHHRACVRVAAPDQAPLEATVRAEGFSVPGRILNLSESGLGLGLVEAPWIRAGLCLDVEAALPGVGAVHLPGEVRFITLLEGNEMPLRVGVLLGKVSTDDLECLRRFVQNRRTDRSESFRHGGV
jgi:hypothetical protein